MKQHYHCKNLSDEIFRIDPQDNNHSESTRS